MQSGCSAFIWRYCRIMGVASAMVSPLYLFLGDGPAARYRAKVMPPPIWESWSPSRSLSTP